MGIKKEMNTYLYAYSLVSICTPAGKEDNLENESTKETSSTKQETQKTSNHSNPHRH